jgi:hypothetical protein
MLCAKSPISPRASRHFPWALVETHVETIILIEYLDARNIMSLHDKKSIRQNHFNQVV